MSSSVIWKCGFCKETYVWGEGHDCPEITCAVATSENCPMCGAEYDSWLDHLRHDH